MTAVLDHGYVKLIEMWGADERIIEAARMSTHGGFVSWDPYEKHPKGDLGLLSYLWKNKHHTPFEMAGAVFEIQCPIFVARQWVRHRTQSYNELSARYTQMPALDYLPSIDLCIVGHTDNKQAASAVTVATEKAGHAEAVAGWLADLQAHYESAEALYQRGLALGVPKERARLAVTVARYTRLRASANLRNWLAFLALRMHSHAQHEIQVYADDIARKLGDAFPRTMALFLEGHTR